MDKIIELNQRKINTHERTSVTPNRQATPRSIPGCHACMDYFDVGFVAFEDSQHYGDVETNKFKACMRNQA